MPAKALTDAAVLRLKPTTERREIPDARASGLFLLIQPSGSKSWAMRFRRPNGQKAKLTLGPLDFSGQELKGAPVIGQPLTLAAARLLAANIHRQRAMGIDVIAEHAASNHRRRSESEQANASTFGNLARQFIEEHAKPNVRRWPEIAVMLGLRYPLDGGEPAETRDGLAQRWADKPVSAIDAHLVYQTIDEARRRGVPGRDRRNGNLSDARGRTMARTLSKFFGWLLEHRQIAVDPTLGMYCPPPPPSRERVLSDDELHWFWAGCDAIGHPFGTLLKLSLLSGCRREEARAMQWSELAEDGTWIIPPSRVKNGRVHIVPLPPLARDLLARMPRIESESGFVFCTNGRTPVSGFSKIKRRLDAAMLKAARSADRDPSKVTLAPWRVHDLRRTAASGLQRLGVRVEVIERCLGHISGSFGGVVGIYQRDPLLEERRAALERWAAHVQGIVTGEPAKVIPLRKGA